MRISYWILLGRMEVEESREGQVMPLLVRIRDRGALPIFTSEERAEAFLASPHMLGPAVAKEVSTSQLLEVLEVYSSIDIAKHVVSDPPPQRWDGVDMVANVIHTQDFRALLEEGRYP